MVLQGEKVVIMTGRKRSRRLTTPVAKPADSLSEEEREGERIEEEEEKIDLELQKISKNLKKLKSFESLRFVSTAIKYSLIVEEGKRKDVACFPKPLGKSVPLKTSTGKKAIPEQSLSDSDDLSVIQKNSRSKLKLSVKKSIYATTSNDQSFNGGPSTSKLPLPNAKKEKNFGHRPLSDLLFSDEEEDVENVITKEKISVTGDENDEESENEHSSVTHEKTDFQLDILDPKFDVSANTCVQLSENDSNLQRIVKISKLKGFLKRLGCDEDYEKLGRSIFSLLTKKESCLFATPISETSRNPRLKALKESNKDLKSVLGHQAESNALYLSNELEINEIISDRPCKLFGVSPSAFLLTRLIETIFKFFSYGVINTLGKQSGWTTSQKNGAKRLFNDILPKLCREQKKLLSDKKTKSLFKLIFHILHLVFKILDERGFIEKVERVWKSESTSNLNEELYVCFKGKIEPFTIVFKCVNDLLITIKSDVSLNPTFNMLVEKSVVKYPRVRSYEFMIRGVKDSIYNPIMNEPDNPSRHNQKWLVSESSGNKPVQY